MSDSDENTELSQHVFVPEDKAGYNFGDCQGIHNELYAVTDCALSCANDYSGENPTLTCRRIGENFVVSGCFLPSDSNTGTEVDNTITDINNDRTNNGDPLVNYHLWNASVGVPERW